MQSIRNKSDELLIFIEEQELEIDAIAITEHWLKSYETVSLEGYELASIFSRSSNLHGGSCIMVKEGTDYVELEHLKNKSKEMTLECSAIKLNKLKIIVINIYRPPNGNLEEFFIGLDDILKEAPHTYRIFLCGDFNINFANLECINTKKFTDVTKSYNLAQTVRVPTRVTVHSSTIVDNIFTNAEEYKVTVITSALADHFAQQISIPNRHSKRESIRTRKIIFTHNNLIQLRQALEKTDWSPVLNCDDADKCSEIFVQILQEEVRNNSQTKILGLQNKRKNWLTDEIRTMSRIKRQLYEGKLQQKVDETAYRSFCQKLKEKVEEAKKSAYSHYIINSQNKVKSTWNIINEIRGGKKNKSVDIADFKVNDEDSTYILSDFNNYLLNVGLTRETCTVNDLIGQCVKHVPDTFSLFLTDSDEVSAAIHSLNNTPAVGQDEIPVKVLKFCSDILSIPLAHVINASFTTGKFPEHMKYTVIKPIYKNKGDTSNFQNYRPIALISNISKIIEKLVFIRILRFVDVHNILSNSQNGYIKGRSTIRGIFQFLEGVINGISLKDCVSGIFIDLSKAFDRVKHEILLTKLEIMGIRGIAYDWLQSYLINRKQCIQLDDSQGRQHRSEWGDNPYGVPQGSILGPLLFLLYVNDMPEVVQCQMVLYADDASCVIKARSPGENTVEVTNTINNLNKWIDSHGLELNISKTQLMLFNNSMQDVEIRCMGNVLTWSDEVSFLGMTLDPSLSWNCHVDHLASKLASFCYSLRVVAKCVSAEAALSAYNAYINSRLRYGVIFWGNCVNVDRIFKLQKSSLRAIFNLKRRDSCKMYFKNNNLLTLPSLYILECALFVKHNYKDFFEKYELVHCHHTRGTSQNLLLQPPTHLTKIQKNVLHQCIKIYNHVPVTIRMLPYHLYKKELRQHLVSNVVYNVNDFFNL